ncbi:hypothetical protein AVEN_188008-1 [Araneus ventricosus]|uniref:Uncharacterized protein n=1 Tax=Araneus ventricosus TaxID=182803 RepID=A0A4Y2HPX4_ARAVE|nr:hypothetical protein AVEN_188008-1 [Araneus ventricosus]
MQPLFAALASLVESRKYVVTGRLICARLTSFSSLPLYSECRIAAHCSASSDVRPSDPIKTLRNVLWPRWGSEISARGVGLQVFWTARRYGVSLESRTQCGG